MPQAFWVAAAKIAVKIAIDIAVTVAINYAVSKLTQKDTKRPPGWSPIKQPVPARHYAYGRGRKRGVYLLYESVSGWTLDVIAYCHGRIGGTWQHWLHDDLITFEGATTVVADQGNGRYGAGKINITANLGQFPAPVHAPIVAVAGAVWTEGHRADGVTTVGIRCGMIQAEKMQTIFPNGEVEHSACADWLCCYDFRKDATVPGGAGAHRRNLPATWEFTKNPVVQWTHDKMFVEGRNWDRFFANVAADLIAEANAADELYPLAAGGDAPRYECFMWYEADQSRRSVTDAFVRSCDGWTIELGDGSMLFRVGRWIEPVDVITDEMIVDLTWVGGIPKSRLFNEVQPRFSNPALDYQVADTTPFRDVDSITKRGRRPYVLEVEESTSNGQTMRLAKIRLLQLMAHYTGQWVLDLDLIPASATRQRFHRVQLQNYQSSLQDCYVEFLQPEIDLIARTLTVDVRIVDPEAYDWDVEEEGSGQVVVDRPEPVPVPAPVISDVVVFDTTSTSQRLRISISSAVAGEVYRVQWRSAGTVSWTEDTAQTAMAGIPDPFIETGNISPDEIEVQIALIKPDGDSTDWSIVDTTALRRITSAGDVRITSAGDTRIVEI